MATPRQQHYQFSHVLLPNTYHRDPYGVSGKLVGVESEMFLFSLWTQLNGAGGSALPHLGPGKRPGTSQTEMLKLRVVARSAVDAHTAVFVGMPPVEAPAESYYVALVQHWPDGLSVETHAYVYDRSTEEGRASLASLSADGMRIALGTHDSATLEAFADAVADDLGIPKLPLEMEVDDGGEALHGAMMARARGAGGGPTAASPGRKGKSALGATLIALVIVGFVMVSTVAAIFQFTTDLSRPGTQVKTTRIEDGERFKFKSNAPPVGVGHDTVWLRSYGSKTEAGKLTIRGKFGCSRGHKRKMKRIKISSRNSRKTYRVHPSFDAVDGWFKLATYKSKAGDRALSCKGELHGAPGTIDQALVIVTRHQRPSDFLGL